MKDKMRIRGGRLPGEIWKEVNDGTKLHWASNKGRIGTVIDPRINQEEIKVMYQVYSYNKTGKKYFDVMAEESYRGKKIQTRVSRMIANAFLDNTLPIRFKLNPSDRRVVNHISNDSENNNLENLEIVTQSENIRHAMDMGISVGKEPIRVQCVETGEIYESAKEASLALGLDPSTVSNVLNPKQSIKSAGGFTFIKL